jgi:uncharacterized membrane protein
MSDHDLIRNYIKSLTKYLARLEKTDAEEVIREIESHIYDALELQEQEGSQSGAQSILDGFGEPRELANRYVEHMLKGTPPPAGFRAIQSVKKGMTKSLYYSMGLFGYSIALGLIIFGLAKVFMPDMVGVWSAAQGNSVTITFSEHIYPNSKELLGYWFIPIAISLGLVVARLTKRVLGVLKNSL